MGSNYGLLYRATGILWFFVYLHIEIFVNLLHNFGFTGWRKRARLPVSLEGKTVLITGANSGIGKQCAQTCLHLGATVVMACRDQTKAAAAIEEILSKVGQKKKDRLLLVQLDLSSLDSVRACAKQINQRIDSIDVLINNAGVVVSPVEKSTDGYEYQFACNHLGHFLLTNLLIDKLNCAPAARIVNVSSLAHVAGHLDLNHDNTNQYSFILYSRSKLANILFTVELANRLKESDSSIAVYSVHPGAVNTGLSQIGPRPFAKIQQTLQRVISLDVEMGSQTTLHCAFSEDTQHESGFHYANCTRVEKMCKHAIDVDDATKLWTLSEKLVSIKR